MLSHKYGLERIQKILCLFTVLGNVDYIYFLCGPWISELGFSHEDPLEPYR